ncbi:small oligopeptide transporter [Mycena floridula]|nr:small oligopeptide transporter [Mycena floridula]
MALGNPSLEEIQVTEGPGEDLRDAEKSTDLERRSSLDVDNDSLSAASIFFDPNLDPQTEGLEEDSPYPEVRSAVANFDDPEMPVSTIRSWTIGLVWAILLAGINQFLFLRTPSVMVASLVALLVVYPFGRVWARFMPHCNIIGHNLNPGPWTIKEHVLAVTIASVGAQNAYATNVIATQRIFYREIYPFSFQWMFVMSTQLIGFSLCGITKRFLISPPSMIWPNTLVSCALFNTLHSQNYQGVGHVTGISREKYFFYVFAGATLWYFVPGYLFQALSMFSWACWIAPHNMRVNQLFGYRSGLGFSMITFDWNQITYIGSPLVTPWWAQANILVGFVFFFWFLTPVLYYTNVWNSQYMPISSNLAFDNTGKPYDVSRILDSNGLMNMTAYKAYSPLYISTTFAISYGSAFLGIAAVVTHTLIFFWRPIQVNFRTSLTQQQDIHARLMSRYPPVPEWYYACIFVITFTLGCLCIKLWPTGMEIWAMVIALVFGSVYLIPIGMIRAITNREIGLNVLTELIVGFMLPGRPIAMMMFAKASFTRYSIISHLNDAVPALQYTQNFKLGHYMKVPPRYMFWGQIVAIVITGTVQIAVQSWMFTIIPDLCEPNQRDKLRRHSLPFSESVLNIFLLASCVPVFKFSEQRRSFGASLGQDCSLRKDRSTILMFFFLIGAACPVLLWILNKKYPFTSFKYINFPLIFTGTGYIPPATSINYVPWALIGFIAQHLVRRKRFWAWARYNYITSAALDAGTALGVILVFFCLQYPDRGKLGSTTIQKWWGNVVFKETADWAMTPLRRVLPGETFGPTP